DRREDGKDEVTGRIDPETGEAVALLGANPVARVRDLMAMEEKVKMQEHEAMLARVVDEMVEGEDARPLVAKLVAAGGPGSEQELRTRVKDVLADPDLRRVLDARFAPAGMAGKAGSDTRTDGEGKLLVRLNY
ncbi:MAG TPA: hypothetical protein PLW63_09290, partial [Bacillota bacterium]|nr:hypothetical protein [Bacillota bacterium]